MTMYYALNTFTKYRAKNLYTLPSICDMSASDGTRVEPELEKPGFVYENWNPGSEIQNLGFSDFEVLLFQYNFQILLIFSVTFLIDFIMKIQLSSSILTWFLIYAVFQMVCSG